MGTPCSSVFAGPRPRLDCCVDLEQAGWHRRCRTRKFNRSLCRPDAWRGRLNPTVWARLHEEGGLTMTSSRVACVLVLLLPTLAVAGDFERGKQAINDKDYDLAITCFTACIRANPTDVASFNNRG